MSITIGNYDFEGPFLDEDSVSDQVGVLGLKIVL